LRGEILHQRGSLVKVGFLGSLGVPVVNPLFWGVSVPQTRALTPQNKAFFTANTREAIISCQKNFADNEIILAHISCCSNPASFLCPTNTFGFLAHLAGQSAD
jgi:hypothetical protein